MSSSEARSLQDSAVQLILESGLREGVLSLGGQSDEADRQAVLDYLRDFAASSGEFNFIFDHRTELLRHFREFLRSGDLFIASILLATWFEHSINLVIRSRAIQTRMADEDIVNMLRETPLRGKMTWLLRLLDLPAIAKTHRDAIMRIMERRNSHVHYKFVARLQDQMEQEKRQLESALADVDRTIRYLQRYESRHIFRDKKKRAEKVLG